jgi:hypothetical protein
MNLRKDNSGAVTVTPRFNYIEIKHVTKEFGTNKIVKAWSIYITFFIFFTDINEVN